MFAAFMRIKIYIYVYIVRVHKKGKFFSFSLPSVAPGADPGVQAVSLQVILSYPPSGRLPLLSARPVVTYIAFTRWHHSYTVAHI